MNYGILVDTTKCTACESCVYACAEQHDISPQQIIKEKAINRDELSAYRPSTIIKINKDNFARKSCMHCLKPSCVSACLVGGITKSSHGPIIYDPNKCIGCRYCMIACPFHIPRYEWNKVSPLMVKCDMCIDLINQGKKPACVEACPNEALIFGNRNTLVKEAHGRINNFPAEYMNHIWGEKEFGGTSVIYISHVDLEKLGWPKTIAKSIPSLTEPLVHSTPFIGLSVAIGLIGVNWMVKRRIKLSDNISNDMAVTEQKEQNLGE